VIASTSGIPRSIRWRVFRRSLFLQASWNPKGMQNLGLAWALYPGLRWLYPDPAALQAAVRRHLTPFNTHPYVAAAIVGGVLYHEERIARGEEGPERVEAFKRALMGPLAALGDGFFWLSLKPAVGALCCALVPLLGAWAALLFVALYNSVHLALRIKLFRLGVHLGDRLVEGIAEERLPTWGARLRAVAAACAGGIAAWLALQFGTHQGGMDGLLLGAACLSMGALSYGVVAKGVPPYGLLVAAGLLAGVAGAFL
jgi:PTS system mannose-specific IID component